MNLTRVVQVAGVIDRDEAEMLISAGVEMLGFPLRLKDGREDLPETEAADIVAATHGRCDAVAITYRDTAAEVIELCDSLGFNAVQLHGAISREEVLALRKARPAMTLIKSLVVSADNEAQLVREIDDTAELIDAYITDTHDPSTGRTGATGKVHDWSVSAALVGYSPKPVILAGGLNPENVGAAISAVRPASVDAHTGLEGPDGRKDETLVKRFLAEARAAWDS